MQVVKIIIGHKRYQIICRFKRLEESIVALAVELSIFYVVSPGPDVTKLKFYSSHVRNFNSI